MSKFLLTASLIAVMLAQSTNFERAKMLYQRTEYEKALDLLEPLPSKNGSAYELIGKCYYFQKDYKTASQSFQNAVDATPGNSLYHLWLGRAYGRRAETSIFFTAPRYASVARKSFEKAVELDPSNLEALSDLFEYYLEAPGFLGGGTDKASRLSRQIAELNSAEGHYTQARLAEKREDFPTAERELRKAIELAPSQVGRVIDLAKFLAERDRLTESEETFRQAETVAPNSPKRLFEEARVYIRAKRNLKRARELLNRFLESPLTPDDPPREEAEQLLKQVTGA